MTALVQRFNPILRVFHWLVAILAFVIWPLGILGVYADTAYTADIFFWHKGLGFALLWIMLARLCIRFLTRTPPLPQGMPGWQVGLAHANQWLLYLALIIQPIIGFLMSNASGHPFIWFDVVSVWSPIGESPIADTMTTAHITLAWTILALVILHILGAIHHQLIRRDNLIKHML